MRSHRQRVLTERSCGSRVVKDLQFLRPALGGLALGAIALGISRFTGESGVITSGSGARLPLKQLPSLLPSLCRLSCPPLPSL